MLCLVKNCNEIADYDSPADLCYTHWSEWFNCNECDDMSDCALHKDY